MTAHSNITAFANALVVGRGSIGQRHADILSQLNMHVEFVSNRGQPIGFRSIAEAIAAKAPDYVVITNDTAAHVHTLEQLSCHYNGCVLVEKPFSHATWPDDVLAPFSQVAVAYPLRFHPAIVAFRSWYTKDVPGDALNALFYCGQYLPDWRPERPYQESYSASAEKGGGVVLDLSHEIDLAIFLLGTLEIKHVMGGRWSDLQIDTEDIALIHASAASAQGVHIQLDYVNKTARRFILINFERSSVYIDLVKNLVEVNGIALPTDNIGRDEIMREMHLDVLRNGPVHCTAKQAFRLQAILNEIKSHIV